jgi:arabinofuranosyltransferase
MLVCYCLLHTLYVVRLGGDFMEGRFLIPVLPFVYLLVEHSVRMLAAELTGAREAVGSHRPKPSKLSAAVLVLFVVSNIASQQVIEPGRIQDGITDERSWIPVVEDWLAAGRAFGEHLPPGTVVATDAVGAFGYESRLPIVDTLGLTDETVAHQPLAMRSRPGHEKAATLEYLTSRNVAVVRDGMGLYRFSRRPDFVFGGNFYFVLSQDPTVRRGFSRAASALSRGNDAPPG